MNLPGKEVLTQDPKKPTIPDNLISDRIEEFSSLQFKRAIQMRNKDGFVTIFMWIKQDVKKQAIDPTDSQLFKRYQDVLEEVHQLKGTVFHFAYR